MVKTRLLFLICSLSFCVSALSQYRTLENLPYYANDKMVKDSYIAERCVLDIYYPEEVKDFPTVVWFHGGGLSGGEKSIPNGLKEKNIAVIAVNYRLYPRANAKNSLEDAAASVAWAFNNIEKYGGNPSLVFVSGYSAGGYLAAMIGLDKNWLKRHQIDANKIAGIIPFSGHMITHFAIRNERNIPDYQPVIDEFAPLYHVRKDAPPLLLITGDRELELLGRYEENAFMMRMMKVAGHKETTLFELDGYGHDTVEPALPLLLKEVQRVSKKTKKAIN